MKKIIIILTAIIAMACTTKTKTNVGENRKDEGAGKDIYVLGYVQDTTFIDENAEFPEGRIYKSVYWKNGIAKNISDEIGTPDGYDMFTVWDMVAINGKLVYLGVAYNKLKNESTFFIWKDGRFRELDGGSEVNTPKLVDIGGDVAVVGCTEKAGNQRYIISIPVMWDNNGKKKTLDMEGYSNCDLHSAFAHNGDVYACGRVYNDDNTKGVGAIWKNGKLTTYTAPGGRVTMYGFTTIGVSGNDIYTTMVCNSDSPNTSDLTLWKNGKLVETLVRGGDLPMAHCIAINGNDVYVGGSENKRVEGKDIETESLARIWKNGKEMKIDQGKGLGYVSSIVVDEGSVYACGNIDFGGVLWTNGKHIDLPGANGMDCAKKVIIVPKKQ